MTPAALAPHIPPLARSMIALCAGLFTGGLMIVFVERMGHMLVPLPATTAIASAAEAMAAMRPANFVMLLVSYLVGTTIGCWIAARMARRQPFPHAAIVGVVFLLGVVSSFVRLPHPTWFMVGAIGAFVAAPFIGARMAGAGTGR